MSSTTALTEAPAAAVTAGIEAANQPAMGLGAGGSKKRGGGITDNTTESLFAGTMVMLLAVMILPLPPIILDLLLACSVCLSLVVFLLSMNIQRALELSSFPSLLLILTLFRLSLNVASTRLILTRGSQGADAVSSVIKAFGEFVVGGNYVIGIIVFLILVIINFVVVTKGSGRVAEVAARFTLDGMPGKQMAIDADLAAGLINEEEAKTRRKDVEREAAFFGAMDGASKFVRGDAIAGLIITAINIVAGLIIGTAQQDMAIGDAATVYTTLTVGDGLVSQIPALLTSVAAGLVVTRSSDQGALGKQVSSQLFKAQRPAALASGMLGLLAIVPGMPHFAFMTLAAGMGFIAYRLSGAPEPDEEGGEAREMSSTERDRAELEGMLPLDLLEIEVGYELVSLVDEDRDGGLLRRITGVRKQIVQEFGVIVPPIHMRDNLRLRPGEYRMVLSGNEIGRGELRVGRFMAMNPGGGAPNLDGEACTEPAFGLAARWIYPADRERAEMMGYTVVDPATVAATHIGELLAKHAYQLLGRTELQELTDLHGQEHSKVIEELMPNVLTHSQVIQVLQGLLKERVSIRDFRSIMEALADYGVDIKDVDQLTEMVRQRLAPQLTAAHSDSGGTVYGLALSPNVETTFRRLQNPAAGGVLNPNELEQLQGLFQAATARLPNTESVPVVLTAADVRRSVAAFVVRHLPGMAVLSYREIESTATLQTVGVVGGE